MREIHLLMSPQHPLNILGPNVKGRLGSVRVSYARDSGSALNLDTDARPACKPDNLTAICEQIVWTIFGILDISQSYKPPQPVTEVALIF
jgi:hypothetical protein